MTTPPPVKKNNNALYIKGCLGCAGIVVLFVLFVVVVGGYLFYREETAFKDHSKEILIVPIVNKGPTKVRIKQEGGGRVKINMWVRGPGIMEVKGQVKCVRDRVAQFDSNKRIYGSNRIKGPRKHVWMRYLRTSSYSKPNNCIATFTRLEGKGPFEIVVTQSQRPSDWFDF